MLFSKTGIFLGVFVACLLSRKYAEGKLPVLFPCLIHVSWFSDIFVVFRTIARPLLVSNLVRFISLLS